MDIVAEFQGLIAALETGGVAYAVCGGFAVTIYGHIRATDDIDLLIQERDLEAVKAVARAQGFTLESGRIPFRYGTPEARELFRLSKVMAGKLLTLDLLLVSPIFADVWETIQTGTFAGTPVHVVSLSGLRKMKRLANRAQDIADLEHLAEDDDGA